MRREKNECIAARAFASLILDYEYSDYVSCRVLIEDLLAGYVTAKDRAQAIAKFKAKEWN